MKKKILLSPLIIIVLIIVAGVGIAGAAILIGGGGNSENVSLQKGLVAWWDMNGNAKDKTPNGNDGTVTAATLINDRKGESQKAYNFTGGTEKITVPNSSSLDIIGNQITISGWINWQGTAGGGGGNGRFVDRENGGGYMIFINDTRKISYRWNANVTFSHTSTGTIANQGWSFITFTYDGANTRIYINGVLDNTFAETTTFGSIVQPLVIGNLSDNTRALDGYLDDIRIYNRPLSQTEITALYQEYNPSVQISDLQKGLVGNWDFNGNTKDKTLYANDGTVVGAVLANDRKGEAQKAYGFNGSSDYISITPTTLLGSAFSISMWTKISSTSLQTFFSQGLTDFLVEGVMKFQTNSSGTKTIVSVNAPPLNTWIHIVVTKSGNSAGQTKLYVNGVQDDDGTATDAPNTGTTRIGNESVNGRFVNGQIDDVRVYNRALSATEVTALYQEYDPGIQVSDLQKGLVAQWRMDGNAKDATMYANNGTITGAALAADRKGQTGKAYGFNGTTDYIDAGSGSSLNITGDKISVAFWINAAKQNDKQVMVKNIGDGTGGWRMDVLTGTAGQDWKMLWQIPKTTAFDSGLQSTAQSVNVWHHVVGTYDGANMNLYIDGVVNVAPNARTGNINAGGASDLYIGSWFGTSAFLNGSLDDIRIYNRALTATEVQALYESY